MESSQDIINCEIWASFYRMSLNLNFVSSYDGSELRRDDFSLAEGRLR